MTTAITDATGIVDVTGMPLRELWNMGQSTVLDHSLESVLRGAERQQDEAASKFNSAI